MDVWRITVAVLRRWYVFLPLMVVTVLATLQVGASTPTQHEVSATTILVYGSGSSDYEGAYGGRSDTTQVMGVILDAPEMRERIEAQGLERDYEVHTESDSALMEVTVLAGTKQQGMDTVEALLELTTQELQRRQTAAEVPRAAQIRMQVLQAPHVSEVVAEGKLRNMAVVGIVGASLSLLVAILFDDLTGLLARWRDRRREPTKGGEEPAAPAAEATAPAPEAMAPPSPASEDDVPPPPTTAHEAGPAAPADPTPLVRSRRRTGQARVGTGPGEDSP